MERGYNKKRKENLKRLKLLRSVILQCCVICC